jgi:hypothetical protein
VAGLDQRRSTEIDVADMREGADNREQDRTQETEDHNLQMGSAVGAAYKMTHEVLRLFSHLGSASFWQLCPHIAVAAQARQRR